jgi:hypothetical protein
LSGDGANRTRARFQSLREVAIFRLCDHKCRTSDRNPVFGEREYNISLPLEIELLAPRGHGVELAPLVSIMSSFPNKSAWSAYMRRALVPLTFKDGKLLARQVRVLARPYPETVQTYVA